VTVPLVEAGLGDLVHNAVQHHMPGVPTSLVVVAMSRDENPKATVLAFAHRSGLPTLVVKVAMTPGARSSVEREADALGRLAQLDPGMVDGTVPSLLELQHHDGHTLFVSTARPGVPFSTDYHRWRHTSSARRVTADFAAAAAWLDLVAERVDLPCRAATWPARLRARWPNDPVADGVAELAARLEDMVGIDRGTVVHGDFWCGNLLRQHGAVSGVVDWEHADFGADPVRDRVRFAVAYTLYLDRHTRPGARVTGHPGLVAGTWGEPVRHLFAGHGWYPELVSRFVGAGLVSTGRGGELWRAAVVLGLVEAAALGDHPEFARQHLLLAGELGARLMGQS
jgi:aminoglycoside phosphotransferase